MTQDQSAMIAAAYLAGPWPEPVRLLIETQAALNPALAAVRDDADRAGGALLEMIEPAAMNPDALSKTLALLDDDAGPEQRAAAAAGKLMDEMLTLPEPVRDAALSALETDGWRFAGLGVQRMDVARDGDTKAELFRIEPGRGAPLHDHHGEEYTLVLSGAFRDGNARYARGDVCVAGPGLEHRPVAEAGDVCYALAVTNAPVAFRGVLGVMQKVFRLH